VQTNPENQEEIML